MKINGQFALMAAKLRPRTDPLRPGSLRGPAATRGGPYNFRQTCCARLRMHLTRSSGSSAPWGKWCMMRNSATSIASDRLDLLDDNTQLCILCVCSTPDVVIPQHVRYLTAKPFNATLDGFSPFWLDCARRIPSDRALRSLLPFAMRACARGKCS